MHYLAQSVTLTRTRNGSFIVRIETAAGVMASKEFSTYEAWAEWAERVLGRVPIV